MKHKLISNLLVLTMLAIASLACQLVSQVIGGAIDAAPNTETGDLPPSQADTAPPSSDQPSAPPASGGSDEIRQWAVSATASSQYSETNWNATQATGAPDVTECGDNGLAWASAESNGQDWIELTYAIPVYPTEINIYQSYNPSQVVKVELFDSAGTAYPAWAGSPQVVTPCPNQMTITFEPNQVMLVNKMIVTIDQSALGLGWNEIDAVELVGTAE